jgi:thymidylate synthase
MKNELDEQYIELLKDILENGVRKNTRNGEVLSVFGRSIRYKFKDGKFPLLTTKKMAWKSLATELVWFLRGDTNIKYLVDNGCHIWDGDCFANYVRNFTKYVDSLPENSETEFIINKDKFINKIKTDDEFANKWGDLGPIYGKQWRSWGGKNVTNYDLKDVKGSDQHRVLKAIENGEDVTKYGVKIEYQNNSIDQIQNLINELKTNPDSRRLLVTAWNPTDLPDQVLPPCHYGFQVYTRELSAKERTGLGSNGSTRLYDLIKEGGYETIDADVEMHKVCDDANVPKRAISLMWNQRSCDLFLGIPFNIASYGLLLEIIAKEVNMMPDELIGNLGDVHLYLNHIEQSKEQISRDPYALPQLKIAEDVVWKAGDCLPHYEPTDFVIENYQSHPAIKAPLSN